MVTGAGHDGRAPVRGAIDRDQVRYFHENGFVVLPGLLRGEELTRLQDSMQHLIDDAVPHGARPRGDRDPDYLFGVGHDDPAERILRRIEYVLDKSADARITLAHPAILATVDTLMGPDLIPTFDSMVLKMPGEGVAVPWHRDAPTGDVGDHPIFNVDIYLDASDEHSALWAVPGSHRWSDERAWNEAVRRGDPAGSDDGFLREGAVQLCLEPGDVLLHDILLLHGSPISRGAALRRVVYFEFRTAHVEAERGPHTTAYIPLKQRVLQACIDERSASGRAGADDEVYDYDPPAPFAIDPLTPDTFPRSFRVVHEEHWRASTP